MSFLMFGAELYILRDSRDDQHGIVKVLDYKTKTCIQTLGKHDRSITAISAHPDLPIIITSSEGGKICIWSSLTWSSVKILQYGFGGAKDICCIKGSNRVVFGFYKELVMVELPLIKGETAEVSDQSEEESVGVEKNDEENLEEHSIKLL